MQKVVVTGLTEHIVDIVTPLHCGHWKPHPKIFIAAARMMDAVPAECIMIGDNPVPDIEPTKALGMKYLQVEREYARRGL